MKKLLLSFILLISSLSNAQYFEGFDNGFPGSMTETQLTATTAWTSCGGNTGGAICPITGTASATFFQANINVAITALNSPTLDLSAGNFRLTFNHIQRARSGKKNLLYAELSQNGGTSWTTIGYYSSDIQNVKNETINLPVTTTNNCKIRFRAVNKYGYAIILDDISVFPVPATDASMVSVNTNPIYITGNLTVAGSIKNTGLSTITNADINWQVDGGAIKTQTLTGLNVLSNTTLAFTHSELWNALPGQHALKVWIANINGTDADATNDAITKTVAIVNEVFPRRVVYEEATGSWCQWCPRGHVGLKDMAHNHQNNSDYIGIAVHNSDPMAVTEYDSGIGNFITGYPSGATNRTLKNVDSGLDSIQASFLTEVTEIPFGKISIPDATWNATTREITFDCSTQFALDLTNANFNVAAVVVENGIIGNTNSYNQKNNYAGGGAGAMTDWQGNNWANLPFTVLAANMVYDHVGRTLLGGFGGYPNSVPTTIAYNNNYTYSVSHILPLAHNINNIEIVALLLDNATGEIVNAGEFNLGAKVQMLSTDNFGAKPNQKFNIYPNPSSGNVKIVTENQVQLSIVDLLGKIVFSATNITKESNIDLSGLQKGIYLAKISDENTTNTQKLIIK